MRLVIFGLAVSSSWGNGHATLWRGLIRALGGRGWSVTFYEHDMPYYSATRDIGELDGGHLVLYPDWEAVYPAAERSIAGADAVIVTSYCPDALAATAAALAADRPLSVFYDLDTPVTLAEIDSGKRPAYVGPEGLAAFDLVLSYTGGDALAALQTKLGARKALPLHGHVDPDLHRPAPANPAFAADLSYLGTFAVDRQAGVIELFVRPAARRPELRFVIGGAQYPQDFPWTENIYFVRHLPPADHPAFFSSSRLTLNVTRRAMAKMGWCPSGRLFEAAACGAALVTDVWPGLETFFRPGEEIVPAGTTADVVAALDLTDAEIDRIRRRARERVLDEHTSAHRARQLENMLAEARRAPAPSAGMREAV
jgi:spore maturation protein CgeB